MRAAVTSIPLTIAFALAGCSERDSNSAVNSDAARWQGGQEAETTEPHETRLTEGRLEPLYKHGCLRQIDGHLFLSKPTGDHVDEEAMQAIESSLKGMHKWPVVWVRLSINVDGLIEELSEHDENVDGFGKDDFLALVGKEKVTPIAPNGMVEVNGLNRFLQQDLIFQVSEDVSDVEVVIARVSLAKFSLPRVAAMEQKDNFEPSDSGELPAGAKPQGSARDVQAAVQRELAEVGVRAQSNDDGGVLVVEGFPYAKGLSGGYEIRIVKVEKGVFTASESSTVPTAMMGMVYGVTGGAFIAQCNAEDGTTTQADAVGNKWVFAEPGMSFNVYLPGARQPAYALTSKIPEATISFTKEGVLVKGFEFIVSPDDSEPEKKAK